MDLTVPALNALRVSLSTAFQGGLGMAPSMSDRVATRVPASTKSVTYGWLNSIPNVREWIGPRAVQSISESAYAITERKWEETIGVDRDDIETDNLGIYTPMFMQMGRAVAAHKEMLIWGLLAAGFATNCYDGQYFFDIDHPVIDANGNLTTAVNTDGGTGSPWFLIDDTQVIKPIIFQARRDGSEIIAKDRVTDENVFNLNQFEYGWDGRYNVGFGFWQFCWGSRQPLDLAHYQLARTSLLGMKGDYGRPLGVMPKLLVVGPSNEYAARLLVGALLANGQPNPYAGTAEVLVVPWLV